MRKLIMAMAVLCCASVAQAQEMEDAIVVTGSRYQRDFAEVVQRVPHVTMVRRADFGAMNLTISSDTRDAQARSEELRQALQGLARQSRGNVTLGIFDDSGEPGGQSRVRPFSVDQAMRLLTHGGRADTSQVTIIMRTPISATDTRDTVIARLDAFRVATPRPGRVDASGGGLELIVINPPQYRAPLVAAIADDASRISAALGQGYGARIQGLEGAMAWRRAGDLELQLFIPYTMVVAPREAAGA